MSFVNPSLIVSRRGIGAGFKLVKSGNQSRLGVGPEQRGRWESRSRCESAVYKGDSDIMVD